MLVGNLTSTMFDPAFIAGLSNVFDVANADLEIIKNLPTVRLVEKGDSTNLIVSVNKSATLVFTWQVSNVRNFPSTDTTAVAAGNTDGFDVVTIVTGATNPTSTFTLAKIGTAYMSKYLRCKIVFNSTQTVYSNACLLEINTGGETESVDDQVIPIVLKDRN
jgi:hypothetical protein